MHVCLPSSNLLTYLDPGSPAGVKVKKVANLKIHDDDANDWARRPTAAEDEDNDDGGIMDGAQVRPYTLPSNPSQASHPPCPAVPHSCA